MNQCTNIHRDEKTYKDTITHQGMVSLYVWNERVTTKAKGASAIIGGQWRNYLCESCAKSLGAWQLLGQEETITIPPEGVQWIESIEEPITIGTPEEAARVAMSLTDEDIERLEREEKFSSLN